MWTIHIDRFLASEGRQRSAVKGDGNCLFRAMSKQLFGTDTLHHQLREFLAVIVLNHDRYQQFYIPSETTTFQQHQESIHQLGVWGTQVEIQAASDSYQMPVYVCSPIPQLDKSGGYASSHPIVLKYRTHHNCHSCLCCTPMVILK